LAGIVNDIFQNITFNL